MDPLACWVLNSAMQTLFDTDYDFLQPSKKIRKCKSRNVTKNQTILWDPIGNRHIWGWMQKFTFPTMSTYLCTPYLNRYIHIYYVSNYYRITEFTKVHILIYYIHIRYTWQILILKFRWILWPKINQIKANFASTEHVRN